MMDELLSYNVRFMSPNGVTREVVVKCHLLESKDGFLVFSRRFSAGDGVLSPLFKTVVVSAFPADNVDNVRLIHDEAVGSGRGIGDKYEARRIDGKFSTDGVRIFNTVSGEDIPEDEPLFLLRGRDELAVGVIANYRGSAIVTGCNDLHVAGIDQVFDKFKRFRAEHPERMKQPGSTRHLKLEDEPQALGYCTARIHDGHIHPKGSDCVNWIPDSLYNDGPDVNFMPPREQADKPTDFTRVGTCDTAGHGRLNHFCQPSCTNWVEVGGKPASGLWRNNPATAEGKYLVKRRDGTVVEWPNFVLGARDPAAPVALRAYAVEAANRGFSQQYVYDVNALAASFEWYRSINGAGDPDRGPHRKDDPKTIEEMRRGGSA